MNVQYFCQHSVLPILIMPGPALLCYVKSFVMIHTPSLNKMINKKKEFRCYTIRFSTRPHPGPTW